MGPVLGMILGFSAMRTCLPHLAGRPAGLAFLCLGVVAFSSAGEDESQKAASPETPGLLQTERVPVRLATSPALSHDGERLAFGWAGDIWTARSNGGRARQLSAHPAYENGPVFSPDGQRIAFTSNRTGKDQVFVTALRGGIPTQISFHSEGSKVIGWYPDGKSLLVEAVRDSATRSASRFYRISLEKREREHLLFDAEGHSGALSPDGKRLLFCREGVDLYRRGYRGATASQIWMAENLETDKPKFTKLIARKSGARSPMWKPDGSGFYYLGDHGPDGLFDVWERDLKTGKEKRLTQFDDDPAILPGISADGSAMMFRKGFEFHRIDLADNNEVKRIRLSAAADTLPDLTQRRTLSKATNVSFTLDGLEIAFIAGGDLWVMDTELREPVPITQTADEEREPVFSKDGETISFIRDSGTSADIWSVKRSDEKNYWWRNRNFKETQLTTDGAAKNDLQAAPDGERISWIAGRGDLWMAKNDGAAAKRLLESWNQPNYTWSPDAKWMAWSVSDTDFNADVWIASTEGKREPYNVSRHPDNDSNPSWSPDGRILAFTGRRRETETDIYYVYLNREDEEKDQRDRKLATALEKMEKARKKPEPKSEPSSDPKKPEPDPGKEPPKKPEPEPVKDDPKAKPEPDKPSPKAKAESEEEKKKDSAPEKESEEDDEKKEDDKPKLPEVKIDFAGLYERIRNISIPDSTERGLFWSHDSKRLAFSAEIKGAKGTYTVTFPDKLTPTRLTSTQGGLARWIAKDDTIQWLANGVPGTFSKGKTTAYSFNVRQSFDRSEHWRTGFRQIWRTMRDHWYDEHLNHLDWDAIGEKYEAIAADAADEKAFDRAIAMMLGELNGSHLGFRSSAASQSYRPSGGWTEETAHLGVTFDRAFPGPGWKVATVIPKGPADRNGSKLAPGDVILKIDGTAVNRNTDPTLVLNGLPSRDIRLTLAATPEDEKAKDEKPAKTREVVIRPISFGRARDLMEEAQIDANRALVEKLSKGRIGYVFVPRMAWNEFIRFEEEIYARGAGKDGLIIDVRDNGGGFTTDHLLTVLTPAEHATTVPRGGGPGYPQDRRVYATWNKPITVLCNQNSFSNAEIFSHAIKELGRGQLVGVPTAGGVISTGATGIMDLGMLRLPFRGWYRRSDGADMELNGAVPDVIVWPHPTDAAAGRDRQISRAVKVLLKDIEAEAATPEPDLVPASELRSEPKA